MIDFVPAGPGRRFAHSRRVRLGDVSVGATLRPDAFARYLQDVAGDDWDDAVGPDEDTWVVRRTSVRLIEGASWPRLGDVVTVSTWCAGTGAAWAERRSDLALGDVVVAQASALWVPIDAEGRPRRIRRNFFEIYGEGALRKVPGRVSAPTLAASATRPWQLRRADFDVVGHVNNAAVWETLSELAPEVHSASVYHLGALEESDDVTLASAPGRFWLVVDGAVRVAGEFD